MVYLKSFLVGVAALVSILFLGYRGLYRLGLWTIHTSLPTMAPNPDRLAFVGTEDPQRAREDSCLLPTHGRNRPRPTTAYKGTGRIHLMPGMHGARAPR